MYARDPHRQPRIGVRGNSVWFRGTLFRQVSSVSPRILSSLLRYPPPTCFSFHPCSGEAKYTHRSFVDRVRIFKCMRVNTRLYISPAPFSLSRSLASTRGRRWKRKTSSLLLCIATFTGKSKRKQRIESNGGDSLARGEGIRTVVTRLERFETSIARMDRVSSL